MQVVETIFDPSWIHDSKNTKYIERWARQFAKPRWVVTPTILLEKKWTNDLIDKRKQLVRRTRSFVAHH